MALADSRKNQAESEFKKAQRALDGKKAMSEYEADAAAVRARTVKLRALRLARDAAEAAAAPAEKTKTKGGTKASAKTKVESASLSDWLKDRQDSGHST
jgi:hypothetical protein